MSRAEYRQLETTTPKGPELCVFDDEEVAWSFKGALSAEVATALGLEVI
jgi:hypothetical protein